MRADANVCSWRAAVRVIDGPSLVAFARALGKRPYGAAIAEGAGLRAVHALSCEPGGVESRFAVLGASRGGRQAPALRVASRASSWSNCSGVPSWAPADSSSACLEG